jgi:hypothetical protein
LTSPSLPSRARSRSSEAVALGLEADGQPGRAAPRLLTVGVLTTPLARGSSGAPLWAVVVAIVVVAVALFLMFGPEWRSLRRRRSVEDGAATGDAEAVVPPPDGEALPGDQ